MIDSVTIESLQNAWPFAESMACYCQCRLYVEGTELEWFLIACNPSNEDTFYCITADSGVELITINLSELKGNVEATGKELLVDENYKRIKAMQQWRKMKQARRFDIGV